MPQEFVIEDNHYSKWSNELRVSSPQDYSVKGTVGLFAQRQVHEIWEDYVMPGGRQSLHLQHAGPWLRFHHPRAQQQLHLAHR